MKIAAGTQQVCADPCGFVEQSRGRFARADDGRPARAQNAGLLAADAVDVVAKPVLMIQIDGGHNRGIGIDDVDGIQAPAETDLEYRDVQSTLRKNPQCSKRAEFE